MGSRGFVAHSLLTYLRQLGVSPSWLKGEKRVRWHFVAVTSFIYEEPSKLGPTFLLWADFLRLHLMSGFMSIQRFALHKCSIKEQLQQWSECVGLCGHEETSLNFSLFFLFLPCLIMIDNKVMNGVSQPPSPKVEWRIIESLTLSSKSNYLLLEKFRFIRQLRSILESSEWIELKKIKLFTTWENEN